VANDASGGIVKEDWVLPVVLQLDGEPTVTEDGNIVYAFPVSRLATYDRIIQ